MSIKNGDAVDSNLFGYDFVAGESLTAGNAVFVGNGIDTGTALQAQETATSTAANFPATTTWYAQSFQTAGTYVSQVGIYLSSTSGGRTITIRIRSSLTGSDLWSTTFTDNLGNGMLYFAQPALTVSASTTYYLVVSTSSTGVVWNGVTSNAYANGIAHVSTDSGGTWGAHGTVLDFAFRVYEPVTVAGRVYKTSANTTYDAVYKTNFIGFALNSVSASSTAVIGIFGKISNQSGLTAGLQYYLSNTLGAISSTAGSVSKKVGVAVSSTELVLINDNS